MEDLIFGRGAMGGITIPVLMIALGFIVRIVFAFGVYIDSRKKATVLAPRIIWIIATFMSGVVVAVGYWLLHNSVLNRSLNRNQNARQV